MKFCLVNGVQQNHIDIQNRGLAYGDGVFTTAKIDQGIIHYLSAHIDRLISGCKKLGINPPKASDLEQDLTTVALNYPLAVLKIIITASSGGRGYARSNSNTADIIIMIHDFPQHYGELSKVGLTLGISKQQLGINPMLSGLKHLNRLEQVLIRQELSLENYDDLLVTNINNEVVEATSANVFFITNETLYTPSIYNSGVNGIMRQAILKEFPSTIVDNFTINDFANAQSIFTCNCISGVLPVSTFNGKSLSIKEANTIRNVMIKAEQNVD